MESQMQRPAHQHIEHDGVGLHSGESNQSGEKKSVMKKVKDKAKKLKHTIKKQGQGQGQEHEYRYDENADEEDDDDDEEYANDREIHGASPTEDSTVIKSTNVPMQLDQDPKGESKARPNIPAQTGYDQQEPSENKHFPSPVKPAFGQKEEENAREPEFKFGTSTGLEEDPQAPKTDAPVPPSNYESKVPDPTGDGGKEAGVGQITRGFDNLNVGDESATKPETEQGSFTGSHDQFNPHATSDNPESLPKSFDSLATEGMPRDTVTGKVSSATSALTDKAVSAKNVVASKLGYGGGSGQEEKSPSNKPESESSPGYTQRITETLNPVYEKVAGAGTAVMSKFQRGGETGNQGGPEGLSPAKNTESESAPGYTQRITEALNPVYEKVAGAGTAVRSKLPGGGEAGNQGGPEGSSPAKKPESESAPGYTQRITETLNPVYEKVAGAGTAVMSKFQGGGDAAAPTTDKGASAKDYWSEKLKPGDEDKALSEAITDALHKKKEGYLQKPGEEKPTGKVTESEDVANRLGTGVEGKREGEDALDAGRQSSGPGVVGRVKDAFGSWIGKGTGTQTAQDSINESYVDHAGEQAKSQE